jgi:hypothetical protein
MKSPSRSVIYHSGAKAQFLLRLNGAAEVEDPGPVGAATHKA